MASLAVSNLFHRSAMKFSETLYRDVDEEESLIAMGGRFVLFSKREREREREGCEKRKKNY